MDEDTPRTLAQFPYVRVRLACRHCPERRGSYGLARLAERFGADANLRDVLAELTRGCQWHVPPTAKRRKYVPYCGAYYVDLRDRPPPDAPPDEPPSVPERTCRLRIVGGRDA